MTGAFVKCCDKTTKRSVRTNDDDIKRRLIIAPGVFQEIEHLLAQLFDLFERSRICLKQQR